MEVAWLRVLSQPNPTQPNPICCEGCEGWSHASRRSSRAFPIAHPFRSTFFAPNCKQLAPSLHTSAAYCPPLHSQIPIPPASFFTAEQINAVGGLVEALPQVELQRGYYAAMRDALRSVEIIKSLG